MKRYVMAGQKWWPEKSRFFPKLAEKRLKILHSNLQGNFPLVA
jgi:hypothetical protein